MWDWQLASRGSSPRGRGTLWLLDQQRGIDRVIPAWAGNTVKRAVDMPIVTGHPRVGGEHMVLDFSYR